jgi:hypothetical protein
VRQLLCRTTLGELLGGVTTGGEIVAPSARPVTKVWASLSFERYSASKSLGETIALPVSGCFAVRAIAYGSDTGQVSCLVRQLLCRTTLGELLGGVTTGGEIVAPSARPVTKVWASLSFERYSASTSLGETSSLKSQWVFCFESYCLRQRYRASKLLGETAALSKDTRRVAGRSHYRWRDSRSIGTPSDKGLGESQF